MENINGIAYSIAKGFFDSFRGAYVILYLDKEMNERSLARISPTKGQGTPKKKLDATGNPVKTIKQFEESKVWHRTAQCCLLNGFIFLLSIYIFEWGLLPSLQFLLSLIFGEESGTGRLLWSWMKPILSFIFGTVWILPLFLLSKVINCLWFQDIADSAYRYSRGRPQFMSSVSKLIADSLFSILVQTLFLVQSMIVSMVPLLLIGELLSLVHMCLLYSLYAFEYKWFNMGWELHRRLTFIEYNWPYFLGFGLPLAILTQLPSSYVISGCVFSILFPLFIISGNEANPVTGTCSYPLQLFSPVIAISNALFNHTIGQNRRVEITAPIRR